MSLHKAYIEPTYTYIKMALFERFTSKTDAKIYLLCHCVVCKTHVFLCLMYVGLCRLYVGFMYACICVNPFIHGGYTQFYVGM